MNLKILIAGGALWIGTGAAFATPAAISGLYNTGVDDYGSPLADGATDKHYFVDGTGVPTVYENGHYFLPGDAGFIGVEPDGEYATPANTFTLTFSLAGLQASTAQLSGGFEADNYGSVYLNGHLLVQDYQGSSVTNFEALTSFFAGSADFKSGLNTLSFAITDLGPPSGLLVSDLSGTADVASGVPEASTWAMMLLGFSSLGVFGYRRATRIGSNA